MKKEDKTNKLEVDDFELLRDGINDSANLLADDELSELFGGYRSCQPGYCEKNFKNGETECGKNYCPGSYVED